MYIYPHGRALGRRQFVIGGGLAATALALGSAARAEQPGLSGTEFDLLLADTPVNLTGQAAVATTVNGTLPGPILRWRQGDTVTLRVRNTLAVPSSIHWHGIRSPAPMDGVPGLSFAGIAPGETFTYRIPLHQSGTYWYHSHSGFQEQTGLYGAIIVEPRAGYRDHFDRDYVVLLSDWSDTDPDRIVANLKAQSDYYNYGQRTAVSLVGEARRQGLGAAIDNRLTWAGMRMSATDLADVSGHTYTYLLNGTPPGDNWTGLFRRGERVRLRFINGSSMTFFDVRIPGLKMSVVQADGNDVEPVAVDEFRIGVAETYDVIVTPDGDAHTIFAQSEDRSGFARGTLAVAAGMAAPVPALSRRPTRTMADMGMGGMAGMKGMSDTKGSAADTGMKGMTDMKDMPGMAGMAMPMAAPSGGIAKLQGSVGVDNVAMSPADRLAEPGIGLDHVDRVVLTYPMLKARERGADPRPPSREITLHLTGNMMRYIWGFDGKKFSDAEPIRLQYGERVRFTLINDTMMEHPIHLHGLWSELENGQDEFRPYKHTIIVKPGEKLSYLVTADTRGLWAYHCHLLYHMEMGMFRTVVVA